MRPAWQDSLPLFYRSLMPCLFTTPHTFLPLSTAVESVNLAALGQFLSMRCETKAHVYQTQSFQRSIRILQRL